MRETALWIRGMWFFLKIQKKVVILHRLFPFFGTDMQVPWQGMRMLSEENRFPRRGGGRNKCFWNGFLMRKIRFAPRKKQTLNIKRMKTKIFSLCALAAAVGLTSCDQNRGTGNGDGSLDILLSSALNVSTKGPATKAPVTASAWTYIAGWEVADAGGSVYNPDYSQPTTWISGGRVQVRTDPSVAYPIALTPVQQYNADNTTRTYIKGWYPSGNAFDSVDVAEGTASLTTNGVVTFAAQDAPDGTVDVLYANAIYGEADDKISDNDRLLVFNHMTTQVNFTVVGTDGLNPAAELTALTLSGARGPISLSLVDDSVTWNTNEQEFELLDADPVVVPHADSSAAVVGFPLMIRPEANNTQLKVTASVDLDGAAGPDPAVVYSDLLLTTASGRFDAGTAYTIRLRVSENGIRLKGYIVPWNDGGTTDLDLF